MQHEPAYEEELMWEVAIIISAFVEWAMRFNLGLFGYAAFEY
jgi:hypothetical protein